MTRFTIWPAILLLALSANATAAEELTVVQPLACPAQWIGEEQLTFEVSWVGARAGTIVMTSQQSDSQITPGHLRVRVKADTSKFFSRFFRVRDQFESCFQQDDFRSLMFRKKIREGRYRRIERTTFDHPNGTFQRLTGKLFFQKTLSGTIPAGVLDPISSLYYMRARSLVIGEQLVFKAYADGKSYEIFVRIEQGKTIKTSAGQWDTVRLTPMPTFEGRVFRKGESKLSIWLATTEPRLPVLIEADLPIGSLRAELTSVSSGAAVPPPEEFSEETSDSED